jgi:hypothetical protein
VLHAEEVCVVGMSVSEPMAYLIPVRYNDSWWGDFLLGGPTPLPIVDERRSR